jgi:hypothetical protein
VRIGTAKGPIKARRIQYKAVGSNGSQWKWKVIQILEGSYRAVNMQDFTLTLHLS